MRPLYRSLPGRSQKWGSGFELVSAAEERFREAGDAAAAGIGGTSFGVPRLADAL